MATLAVALLLLIALTSVTLYTARVLILEQRIARNGEISVKALEAAEAGAAFGLAYLNANRSQVSAPVSGAWGGGGLWASCPGPVGATVGPAIQIPCGNEVVALAGQEWLYFRGVTNRLLPADPTTVYRTHYLTPNNGGWAFPFPLVRIVVESRSDVPDGVFTSGTGRALVHVAARARQLFRNVPSVPLMVNGDITDALPATGQALIWGRSDGLGPGMPFSVWAAAEADPLPNDASQSNRTCDPTGYPNCNLLSGGSDIVEAAEFPVFPVDMFLWVFGLPVSDARDLRDTVHGEFGDCMDVPNLRGGLYWISGDCELSSDTGSDSDPLMLIVEGQLTLSGSIEVYGAVYVTASGSGDVQTSGSPTIHGALLVDGDLDFASSNLFIEYDPDVLAVLNRVGGHFAFVPGSWNDDW